EIRVAVLPARAGVEVERLPGPVIENAFRTDGLLHAGWHVVLRPEILIAGGVRQDLAYRDLVAAREAGHVLRDGIVERELPFLLQEQDGRRRELLADRADSVAHVGRGRDARVELRRAIGVRVQQAALPHHG